MSEKAGARKQRKKVKNREEMRHDPLLQGPPMRNYKFLSKLYSSLKFGTNNLLIASERIKVLRKLGLSNSKFLRKVKIVRCNSHENFWLIYLRSLLAVRGDLREIEFENFVWKEFYEKEEAKPIWAVILGKCKRLQSLKSGFLVNDMKQLRILKRYRKLKEASFKVEGNKMQYDKLYKAFRSKRTLDRLHIFITKCTEINDPHVLAAAIDQLKGLREIKLFFELNETNESPSFYGSVLESVTDLFRNLSTKDLVRVQVAAKKIMNAHIQSTKCAQTAANFFDVVRIAMRNAGKRALKTAAESLGDEFDILELDFINHYISSRMVTDQLIYFKKMKSLNLYHKKNDLKNIAEKADTEWCVDRLGFAVTENVAVKKDFFQNFLNVKELNLVIKCESKRNVALESLMYLLKDNFQTLRLKFMLAWEAQFTENDFDNLMIMLSQMPKLKSLDLELHGSYFGKKRFVSLAILESSQSLEEMTISIRSYFKNIRAEDINRYFRGAKKLKRFELMDYSPEQEYDKAALLETLGRTLNIELINC